MTPNLMLKILLDLEHSVGVESKKTYLVEYSFQNFLT